MTFSVRCCGGRLQPELGFSLFALCGVLLLLGLGFWQIERQAWKHDLMARINDRMAAPAVDFPAAATESPAWDYRQVKATGVFDYTKELHLAARDVRHSAYGYQILVPLRLEDGRWLLVSRGWVPQEKKAAASRAEGQVAGTVTVTGIARLPQGRRWMAPENNPERNVWLWLDMVAMAKAAGVEQFAPLYLEADATSNPGGWPRGGQTRVRFTDNHFIYAITWFSLALALIMVWGVKSWQREPSA